MKTTVNRFDTIRMDEIEVDPRGFLRVPVYAARTGIQVYRKKDGGTLKEYRPDEEVFAERAMSSLRGCPVTNDHPAELVDPQNAKELMVGYTGDSVQRAEGRYLKTTAIITDSETIADIRAGKREVSMGYTVELDFTPGVFNGQEYDCVQRDIEHNHLAIVDRGRAGPEVRLRLDSDAMLIEELESNRGGTMKVKIGDKEFDLDKDVATAVNSLLEENKSLKEKVDAKGGDEDEAARLKKENESLQAKNDALESDLEKEKKKEAKVDADAIAEAVRKRTKLVKAAESYLEDSKGVDDMSDREIKEAVIKADSPECELEGKSDDYVDARFDYIIEKAGASKRANEKISKKLEDDKSKEDEEENEDSYEVKAAKNREYWENRWKEPVGRTKTENARH